MNISKKRAQQIWNYRQWHDGYAEDSGEWLDAMSITREEMAEFENIVQGAIDSLGGEEE